LAGVTVAHTANARSAIVTENVGGIVGSTRGLVVAKAGCVGVTLAIPAGIGITALANSALQVTLEGTLLCFFHVTLE